MKRWILSGIVLVGGVIMVACGDQRSDAPAGPVASVTALTTLPACDLSGTNPLIAQYFNASDARIVRDLIDHIGTDTAGSVIARDGGFDIIAIIARNAQAGTGGDASAASDLINKITACMFRDTTELPPESYPEDYTVAIADPAGGLGVRGDNADPSDPVLSRDSFSVVAPAPRVTWVTTLGGTRIVLYGRPGLTARSYDWKVLPRNARFSPPAVVGLCVSPDNFPTTMLHEEHVGLLAFAEADFPTTCPVVSPRSAFSAFTSQLAQLFLPQRLSAALVAKGIGGSTGGIGSEFSPNDVPNVSLAFTARPPTSVTVGDTFSVQVLATDPVSGDSVPGTSISIVAVNNNGDKKALLGTTTDTTDNTGLVMFRDLRFGAGSTGGYRLVVSGNVVGRLAIKVGQLSSKINVKPAK